MQKSPSAKKGLENGDNTWYVSQIINKNTVSFDYMGPSEIKLKVDKLKVGQGEVTKLVRGTEGMTYEERL